MEGRGETNENTKKLRITDFVVEIGIGHLSRASRRVCCFSSVVRYFPCWSEAAIDALSKLHAG